MDHYLSQTRIEGPIWLEHSDISFLQSRISELETQIESTSRLDAQKLEHIRQLRGATLLEIASIRNILSPIRRVPLEILSEILVLSCLPASGRFVATCDIVYHTYAISSVCLAWRNAAHASPQMWSKLCIDIDSHRTLVMRDARWVEKWIARSQGLSLELHLNFWEMSNDDLEHAAGRLLKSILDFRHQFQYLNLSGDPFAFLPLFCLSHSSLPSLEKISLCMSDILADDPAERLLAAFPDKIEVFFGAPRLQHVCIKADVDASLLTALMLPLEQLTSLAIDVSSNAGGDGDPTVYVDTLSHCRSLESLCIHLIDGQEFFTDHSISLHALKSLDISFPKLYTGSTLLHSITAPLLEDMTLHCEDQDIHTVATEVAWFQDRSKIMLLSLTLTLHSTVRGPNFTTTDLSTILATFPSVKSFRLHNFMSRRINAGAIYDMNSLLGAMIYNNGSNVLLPKLEAFELFYQHPYDFSYPSNLTSMILSRCQSKESEVDAEGDVLSPLQKVTLRCVPGDLEEISSQISSFSGLTLEYIS